MRAPSALRPAASRSALARPLDFTYPSNRVAALGLLGTVALARLRGRSWADAIGAGGTAFLAWEIGRAHV